jgi:hypothetical protein
MTRRNETRRREERSANPRATLDLAAREIDHSDFPAAFANQLRSARRDAAKVQRQLHSCRKFRARPPARNPTKLRAAAGNGVAFVRNNPTAECRSPGMMMRRNRIVNSARFRAPICRSSTLHPSLYTRFGPIFARCNSHGSPPSDGARSRMSSVRLLADLTGKPNFI